MTQIDRPSPATVPNLDGRDFLTFSEPGPLARLLAQAPVAVVFAGAAGTVLWTGFLGWCLFSAVRWVLS